MSEFVKGQRVRVVDPQDIDYHGREFTVELQHLSSVLVEDENGAAFTFFATDLEILHDGREESAGVQPSAFKAGDRVVVTPHEESSAGPVWGYQASHGTVTRLGGGLVTVALDGRLGVISFDPTDLALEEEPEHVPSKRDEYAAKAEMELARAEAKAAELQALQAEASEDDERDVVLYRRRVQDEDFRARNAALVFATLAVAYGREQGR